MSDYLENLDRLKGLFSSDFIDNNYEKGRKVSFELAKRILSSDEFYFSVAFITFTGLQQILNELDLFKNKGKKAKILTTNYQNFTEPKALRKLISDYPNIEVRLFDVDKNKVNFHTKGYIFKTEDKYSCLIGSSNLTQNAITVNEERNNLIEGDESSSTIKEILNEFNDLFSRATPLEEIIDQYESKYNEAAELRKKLVVPSPSGIKVITPNKMQVNFINSLNELIKSGERRALLISATGTGKTIASILALQKLEGIKLNRLLFVTHRLSILKQAKEVYDSFFSDKYSSSLLTGESKENLDADFIFASSSTICKPEYYEQFNKDHFDFIIVDEVHRVGANKYLDLINYFTPKFLLGMTATPDRTDDFSLYELFDYNIAYEIRILEALEEDLLAPFIYYGVTDLTVNGEIIEDKTDFTKLTATERVRNVIEKSKHFGFSGNRVKGLIFVSGVEEGEALEEKFKDLGYRVKFLSGNNSLEEREVAIKMLEEDNPFNPQLDFILTVDIFNEGVDIPSVNQIIFLRPTKSSIVFLQQLGRGLRKYKGKENVVVLDFIGNYNNNFMIAKALCKKTATQEELIKTVEGILPGSSSIHFDEISKEEVFKSIKNNKISDSKNILNQYKDVKGKLGHIPSLLEFEKYSGEGKISARVFIDYKNSSYKSYYEFLKAKELDYKDFYLSDEEETFIEYYGKYLLNGIRKKDIEVVQDLANNHKINLVSSKFSELEIKYYESILNYGYLSESEKYPKLVKYSNDSFEITDKFRDFLSNKETRKQLNYLIEYGFYSNEENYNGGNNFVLYERYQRADTARLILMNYNYSSTVYGYQLYKEQNVIPVFVDYDKKEDQIAYSDHFINKNLFHWNSRRNRVSYKGEIKDIIDTHFNNKAKILLFVQKAKDDGFYYIGEAQIIKYVDSKDLIDNKEYDVVHFDLKLETECRSDVYNYLTSNLDK